MKKLGDTGVQTYSEVLKQNIEKMEKHQLLHDHKKSKSLTKSDKKLSITKNICNKNEMNNGSNKYVRNEMNNNSRDKRRYDKLNDVVNTTDANQKLKMNSAKHNTCNMYNIRTNNYFEKLSSSNSRNKNVSHKNYLNENIPGSERETKPFKKTSKKIPNQISLSFSGKLPMKKNGTKNNERLKFNSKSNDSIFLQPKYNHSQQMGNWSNTQIRTTKGYPEKSFNGNKMPFKYIAQRKRDHFKDYCGTSKPFFDCRHLRDEIHSLIYTIFHKLIKTNTISYTNFF